MCGLAGLLLSPRHRSPAAWARLRDQFTANLLANAARGRAATGIALIQRNGTVQVHKAPQDPATFVETPDYQQVLKALNQETTLLIGHTRHPTQGSPTFPDNNHPIFVDHVLGAHNGHIHNDAALFRDAPFQRRGDVDSEIIFHLLEHLEPTPDGMHYLAQVQGITRRLAGRMGVLAVDLRQPERLLIIKRGAPLSIHADPDDGIWHFSSRYLFLRKTFGPIVILQDTLKDEGLYLFDPALTPEFLHQPL